jgi:hypothetical protein
MHLRHFAPRLSLLAMALLGSAFAMGPSAAQAVSGSDFQAGRIIDDQVFYNKSAMSVQGIQAFLNSKVPTCDTNGTRTSEYDSSMTRAQYGTKYGFPPAYTCLKDYYENPSTHANNYGGSIPAGAISAAQIIYNEAQNYSINPQVLLVLLQKESSLVTDDWPYLSEYTHATGYGCPDTAPCDTQYYGFFNQVHNAARQFRLYATNPSSYSYIAGQNNNIQYKPGTSCGSQTVFIQNQATAGLYNYTPYVPNAAALNNLYGTGDGCSSYGNRNFWRLFNDWFGSTLGADYYSSYAGQCTYPTIQAGSSAGCYLEYSNLGRLPWYDNTSASTASAQPVHLATSHALNRISSFGANWANQNRPAVTFSAVYESDGTTLASNQHVVQPGQIAKFSFTFDAPASLASGTYREYFQPIVEGGPSTNDPGTFVDVRVTDRYASVYAGQSAYPTIKPSAVAPVYLSYTNAGNTPWCDNSSISSPPPNCKLAHLASSHAVNRVSIFGADWYNGNRPGLIFAGVYKSDGTTLAANQHVAQPGEIAKFAFNMSVPANQTAGTYTEYFQPILEGVSDMNDPSTFLNVIVPNASVASAQLVANQSIVAGATKSLTVGFINTGNTTWSASNTKLYTANTAAGSFHDTSWQSSTVVSNLNETSVAPGQTGTFNLPLRAPVSSGNATLAFAPGDSNGAYGGNNAIQVSVSPAVFTSAYAGQSGYPTIVQGRSAAAYLRYKNTGNIAWYDNTSVGSGPTGSRPVHLATSHSINRSSAVYTPGNGEWCNNPDRNRVACDFGAVYESDGTTQTSNQHVVQPGQIVQYNFKFSATILATPAVYREYFQPIVEGLTDMNDPGTFLDVSVTAGSYSSAYAGQSPYPVITRPTSGTATTAVYLKYKNTGNQAWYDNQSASGHNSLPTHLSTSHQLNRASAVADVSSSDWCNNPDRNRPACSFGAVYEADGITRAADQHAVQPGQIAEFDFSVAATSSTAKATYREFFQPIIEFGPAMNDPWTFLDIVVN